MVCGVSKNVMDASDGIGDKDGKQHLRWDIEYPASLESLCAWYGNISWLS